MTTAATAIPLPHDHEEAERLDVIRARLTRSLPGALHIGVAVREALIANV